MRGKLALDVKGLPLTPNTVIYYYTYGSVLSALSRPQQSYCDEALDVFTEVRLSFGTDIIIMPIVQAGEAISQGVAEKWARRSRHPRRLSPEPSPTVTP